MPSIDSTLSQQGYSRGGGEPGPSFGESFSGNAGGYMNAAQSVIDDIFPSRTTTRIDRSKQTNLSPEAIDQFIYGALSGNSGISAIKTAEAGSGGYGSSSSALQSADLIAAVAGQIGEMTGPKVEQSETTSKKKKSVVCTALYELGDIPEDLYREGQKIFQFLPVVVVCGYYSWGCFIAQLVPKNRFVRYIAKFITLQRYEYVLHGRWNLAGWISVVIAEPICGLIGRIILRGHHGNRLI